MSSNSRKVRLAYTDNTMVTFTPRGRDEDGCEKGFIRLKGRTITGWIGRGFGAFFATGANAHIADEVTEAAREEVA